MLLNEQETRALEDRVSLELRFRPSAQGRSHSLLWWKRPFRLPKPWAVYALDEVSQEQIEKTPEAVKACLLSATEPGKRLYAMDWYHCAFLYDPRKEEEQKRVKLEDGDGKYRATISSWTRTSASAIWVIPGGRRSGSSERRCCRRLPALPPA